MRLKDYSCSHQLCIILFLLCLLPLLPKLLQMTRQLIQDVHEGVLQLHGLYQWLHILHSVATLDNTFGAHVNSVKVTVYKCVSIVSQCCSIQYMYTRS